MVCLLATVLVGCRHDASQRDAYIRELRMQEDEIYELEDYMTEYQHLLREQRKENAKLREKLKNQGSTGADEDDGLLEDEDAAGRSLLDPPGSRDPAPALDPDDDAGLPDIDLGSPMVPDVDLGEPAPMPDNEPLPLEEIDDLSQLPFDQAARLASTRQTSLELPAVPDQPAVSCALYAEQLPTEAGADVATMGRGVMAIVEPLTDDGAAGAFAGEVSLMLVDPQANDDEWEIARWNFTAEEVEAAWRDKSRRVLDLPVAVPESAPLDRLLELWVRLTPTGEDRKMLCSTGLTLAADVQAQANRHPVDRVTTDWAAANPLDINDSQQSSVVPARWTASAMPMPKPVKMRAAEPRVETAQQVNGVPDAWSPLRK